GAVARAAPETRVDDEIDRDHGERRGERQSPRTEASPTREEHLRNGKAERRERRLGRREADREPGREPPPPRALGLRRIAHEEHEARERWEGAEEHVPARDPPVRVEVSAADGEDERRELRGRAGEQVAKEHSG